MRYFNNKDDWFDVKDVVDGEFNWQKEENVDLLRKDLSVFPLSNDIEHRCEETLYEYLEKQRMRQRRRVYEK